MQAGLNNYKTSTKEWVEKTNTIIKPIRSFEKIKFSGNLFNKKNMARKEFNPKIKEKSLLCCDRHCCLCGKQCGTNIEVHHIDKPDDNSFDNAIPLCFDCHAHVEAYKIGPPKGNKVKTDELKTRRNQIFDKYTSPYLPLIEYNIIGGKGKNESDLPLANFVIINMHRYLKCQAKVKQKIYHNKKLLQESEEDQYNGNDLWNLNPHKKIQCPRDFKRILDDKFPKKIGCLQVEYSVILIDKFEWEHENYPVSWIYTPRDGWYYEPFFIKNIKE